MIARKRLWYFDFSQIAFNEILPKGISGKNLSLEKEGMEAWWAKI